MSTFKNVEITEDLYGVIGDYIVENWRKTIMEIM